MATGKRKEWRTVHGAITTVHIRRVPESVRNQFKAYCARRGYTMGAAIIAFMRKCVHENPAIPQARKDAQTPTSGPPCMECGNQIHSCKCV